MISHWLLAWWLALAPQFIVVKRQAVPTAGGGAISFDAVSGATQVTGSTLTWSHTCTGSNRALFVSASSLGDSPTVTGVTYNSVAMTQLWNFDSSGGVSAQSSGWILVAPATGAHNIVITLSGGSGGYIAGIGQSWTEVNQTTPTRTAFTTSADGSPNPISLTVSDAQSGDVVVDGAAIYDTAHTAVGNQTQRRLDTNISGSNYTHGSQSAAATGSTVMQWTNPSGFASYGAVALRP